MPLSVTQLPSEVTINVQDLNREISSTSVFFANSFSLVDIIANVAALELVIAGMTDGNIVSGGLSRSFVQTTVDPDGIPPVNSNVQRKGIFVFRNSLGSTNTYSIPSISRSIVLPGSVDIDTSNPAVAAYIAFMTGGLAGVVGSRPVGGNAYTLTSLVAAYEDTVSRPNTRR